MEIAEAAEFFRKKKLSVLSALCGGEFCKHS